MEKISHTHMHDDLIARFKTGHQSIVWTIDQIQLLMRSYFKAKPKIRELNEQLLAHFSKQNDQLFDQLRTAHRSDRKALKMIEFLIHDLKDAKVKYVVFSEKHSGEMADISAQDFPADFMEFSCDILARINIEEDYLLPLIANLPAK